MGTRFKELIISGSFELVKGFLLGYREGAGKDFKYFFHRKTGIRRDTLIELVKEALELDNYVHVCLEELAAENFIKVVNHCHDLIGLEVSQEKLIRGARFGFSFSLNNHDLSAQVKQTLDHLPEGVHLEGYSPEEKDDPEVERDVATAGYAPLHEYSFRGQGTVAGDFDGVVDLFLRAKRLLDPNAMKVDEIVLEFGN